MRTELWILTGRTPLKRVGGAGGIRKIRMKLAVSRENPTVQ